MVYRETFSPMNEQEITNIEIQFNVQFPTDYRMYLKEIGGGFAEWSESNGIYVEDVKDKVFIDEMFGNIDIDSARIDFWTKKYQDEMFEKSIIIGDSLEHGFFVLVCEGETIFYKGIMPSEKVLDFPVDCNTLTGSVNL